MKGREAEALRRLHVQFPDAWVSNHVPTGGRPSLWEGKRDAAGRPIFTRNSRIVKFVRAQIDAAAAPTASARTPRPKRGLRRGQVGVKHAVYSEIGFILEQLMEQLIVSPPPSSMPLSPAHACVLCPAYASIGSRLVCVRALGGQVTAVGIAARRARGHHRQSAAQHEHNDASTVTATDRAHTEKEKAGPAGTGAGTTTTATTATIVPFHAFPELPPSGSRTADPESRNAQHQRRQRKQPVPLPPPEPPPRPITTTGASAPSNPKRRRCMAAARGCWSETDDQRLRHAVKTHEGAGGWRAVAAALGGGRSIRAASGRWKRLRRSDAANCEVVIERQDWIVALKAHGLEYLANGSAAGAAASSVIVASAPAATATVAAAPVGEQEPDEAW
eukprot:COSAG01_NODE_14365_length_1463_cov_2.893695_1_plen_388_part_10